VRMVEKILTQDSRRCFARNPVPGGYPRLPPGPSGSMSVGCARWVELDLPGGLLVALTEIEHVDPARDAASVNRNRDALPVVGASVPVVCSVVSHLP
jgi:hypothetical protein